MLTRSERAGGAGVTLLKHTKTAAVIGARSATANTVRLAYRYFALASSGTHCVINRTIEEFSKWLKKLDNKVEKRKASAKDFTDAANSAPLPEPHCAIRRSNVSKLLTDLQDELNNKQEPDNEYTLIDGHRVVVKVAQSSLVPQVHRLRALQEYYDQRFDRDYFPQSWSDHDILTHLRTAITSAMGANGAALWNLKTRRRDPFTRQFCIAARQSLGLGLEYLIADGFDGEVWTGLSQPTCSACKQHSAMDSNGFHLLYSCHAQQGNRNRRHAAVQRAYEELAKRANLTVTTVAPDVTPYAHNNKTILRTGKKEFADWSVYDGTLGTTVVFDNTTVGMYTASARQLACKPRLPDDKPRFSHPAGYSAATERRRTKFANKGEGSNQRDNLFLPLINTPAGGFVPQDPETLPVHTAAAKRFFGSNLAQALGRVGTRPRSIEEGIIRRWSRKVADTEDGGKGVFDATLSVDRAAGLLTMHTHRKIAYAALRTSADAALVAIQRHGSTFAF